MSAVSTQKAFWVNFKRLVDTAPAREVRYRRICELVGLRPLHRVLDVGCGNGSSFEAFNRVNEIVGVDLYPDQRIFQENFRYVRGDAERLDFFQDHEFDLVVCIGVMEHIVPSEKLKRAANEIRRIGKAYVVVVPHMFTLIEPHNQLPFWQLYPVGLKRFVRKRISIGSYRRTEGGEIGQLNYLRAREWSTLFPDASVVPHNHVGRGLIRDYLIYKPLASRDFAEASA